MSEVEQQIVAPAPGDVVLVVEDDAFLRRMLTEKLHKEGLNVFEATNGTEAHESLNKQTPNIILLDLMMPGTDGFQLLREIKTDAKTKDIPVMVLSNLGEKEHIERAMSLGVVDYMIKAHFVLDEIVSKIKSILNK
ncbi:MAG: response regulator [Patescibacteria group bacterium]